MGELLYALEESLAEIGRAVMFLVLPPWALLIVAFLRNSVEHLIKLAAALGAAGAIAAQAIVPGAYWFAGSLDAIGLHGTAAALVSGLVYGVSGGPGCVWIRPRTEVVRRPGSPISVGTLRILAA